MKRKRGTRKQKKRMIHGWCAQQTIHHRHMKPYMCRAAQKSKWHREQKE